MAPLIWAGKDTPFDVPAATVKAVDTTGAGDTYLGYVLAGLDDGATARRRCIWPQRRPPFRSPGPGRVRQFPPEMKLMPGRAERRNHR